MIIKEIKAIERNLKKIDKEISQVSFPADGGLRSGYFSNVLDTTMKKILKQMVSGYNYLYLDSTYPSILIDYLRQNGFTISHFNNDYKVEW